MKATGINRGNYSTVCCRCLFFESAKSKLSVVVWESTLEMM